MTLTCGIIIVDSMGRILIGHPTYHPENLWSIPKGVPHKGETHVVTAMRETKEETGIDILKYYLGGNNLTKVGEFVYPNKKKTLIAYTINIKTTIDIGKIHCDSMVDPETYGHSVPEIDKYMWATKEDALKLVHPSQIEAIKQVKIN